MPSPLGLVSPNLNNFKGGPISHTKFRKNPNNLSKQIHDLSFWHRFIRLPSDKNSVHKKSAMYILSGIFDYFHFNIIF